MYLLTICYIIMKRYLSVLKRLGLNEKEANIYLGLVENWLSTITEIIERSSLHRPEAYRMLPVLKEQWFISEVRRWKKRLFSAESPEKLSILLESLSKDLDNVLPDLLSKHSSAQKRPLVKYFEWAKWISSVFTDIVNTLNKWDIFYRISSEKDVDKANSYLPKDYREKRDKKHLERYVIMSETQKQAKKPRLEREVVTIPPHLDEFSDDVHMVIYWNKVAFIDYNSESTIIIENSFIASFQLKLFKMLFKSLTPGSRTPGLD